jgi:hypothetical protein
MPDKETEYFELLKKEVAGTFRKSFPYCTNPIGDWKGQEIIDFQEDLLKKVKGQISEKWFYTHFKQQSEKLPRIDMLNMLCQYAGYHSWNEFANRKKGIPVTAEVISSQEERAEPIQLPPVPIQKKKKHWWIFPMLGITAAAIVLMMVNPPAPPKTFQGCLIDITGAVPSDAARIDVIVLREKESPVTLRCDSNGCFKVESASGMIRFIIRSPYYSTDTITRILNTLSQTEKIKVCTDDYALMIHYFSTSNINDWKKRRMQLDDMITEDAKIYQVFGGSMGMELYNKDEFVDRMTMPLKSLKNVEIIETNYVNGRINKLKFKLNEKAPL